MDNSPVIIGEITGVFGVKGWVKVFSHTEPRANIIKYNPWLIKQGADWKSVKLIEGRTQGKTIVAQIEGVDNREQAQAMIGTVVAINRSQMQKLGANDFYWRDLEGLEVVDLKGDVLGRISHLIETGANDVMVVKLPSDKVQDNKTKEIMIPYLVDSVVKNVDLEANRMLVDWEYDYL